MIETGPLYVIIDPEACKNTQPFSLLEMVVSGGVKTIQLRAKNMPDIEMLELAKKMSFFCKEKGVLFIVNDRLDIAMASNADGVHLGQDDLPIKAARSVVGPDFTIGLSTHNTKEAVDAQKAGADYIGFGAMYKTSSKADVTEPKSLEKLREIVKKIDVPVVAIGGINLSNIREISETGASSAAVISAVSSSKDPFNEVQKLLDAWRT